MSTQTHALSIHPQTHLPLASFDTAPVSGQSTSQRCPRRDADGKNDFTEEGLICLHVCFFSLLSSLCFMVALFSFTKSPERERERKERETEGGKQIGAVVQGFFLEAAGLKKASVVKETTQRKPISL